MIINPFNLLNEQPEYSEDDYRVIKLLLELPPWKCPECGTINHCLNKRCVYCWIREVKEIPRQ